MANEFFRHYGKDVAITISPRGQSIMEVFFNGERIYDKKGEGNVFPDLKRVREMRQFIDARLEALEPAPADD
jgi:predicted Rdx family selenoprotein